MNTIKVFLASSIKEFSEERQTLMAFFQTLNNIYHERGVFLEMIICESLSHQMQNVRAQEMYTRSRSLISRTTRSGKKDCRESTHSFRLPVTPQSGLPRASISPTAQPGLPRASISPVMSACL